jgi:hypothetical protein
MTIARIVIYNKVIAAPFKVIDIRENERYLIPAIIAQHSKYSVTITYYN